MTIKPLLLRSLLLAALAAILLFLLILVISIYRTLHVLRTIRAGPPSTSTKDGGRHLLIVLGSGGHTAEMISVLRTLGLEYIASRFCGPTGKRTWVVSEGDGFSANRAQEFEKKLQKYQQDQGQRAQEGSSYEIIVVPRARKVHQSLLSTPVSALWCLWSCVQLLRGEHRVQKKPDRKLAVRALPYPDLILMNGPGTAVIVVLASLLLKIVGYAPHESTNSSSKGGGREDGLMRTIYVESWARVKTLSLSGKILRFMVGRFLVQWHGMEDHDLTKKGNDDATIEKHKAHNMLKPKIEYVGTVVT